MDSGSSSEGDGAKSFWGKEFRFEGDVPRTCGGDWFQRQIRLRVVRTTKPGELDANNFAEPAPEGCPRCGAKVFVFAAMAGRGIRAM